tara:strand:- start:64 stop:213 length:150 start_codon:yes stop_codon:yes gene_type:complete
MLGNINKYIIFFLLSSFFSHAIAKEKKWMSLNKISILIIDFPTNTMVLS